MLRISKYLFPPAGKSPKIGGQISNDNNSMPVGPVLNDKFIHLKISNDNHSNDNHWTDNYYF